MQKPKRVLCVMDLSLVGRAALSVALPVYSACGVQACALPASLFSTHTGGFGPVVKQDEAAFCERALDHFVREGITFDAVHIGYLFGPAQFALAQAALALYPTALHLVDPALGDDGKLYGGLDDDTVRQMRTLCEAAQLVTPNYTESALLCGLLPGLEAPDAEALTARLTALSRGGRSVVITSVPTPNDSFATACITKEGQVFSLPSRRVPQRYPGTGDTFSAALCGLLLQGLPLPAAAQRASSFVEQAAHHTYSQGGQARHGLWLEPLLATLAPGGPPAAESR